MDAYELTEAPLARAPRARRARRRVPPLAVLDIGVKATLLLFLALVAIDPTWGHLEGKAPMARAILYPLPALLGPLVLWRWCRGRPFPWGADLLISLTCFSDILGNRLDLYDTVSWFDDWMHFMNTGLLAGALVVVTTTARHSPGDVVLRALAIGVTLALAWEAFEYRTFVRSSPELPTAYADTVVDLCLGWLGSLVAGVVVAWSRSRPWARERSSGRR